MSTPDTAADRAPHGEQAARPTPVDSTSEESAAPVDSTSEGSTAPPADSQTGTPPRATQPTAAPAAPDNRGVELSATTTLRLDAPQAGELVGGVLGEVDDTTGGLGF